MLKLGEAQGEQAEKTAGPKSRTAFLWRRQGTFTGTHPRMHPVRASTTSHPSRTAPGDHSTIRHIQGTHALSHTQVSQAHRRAHTYVARTHTQGRNGESLGCEAGRLLCCSCPRSGKVRPLLWERPCEDDGWGWVTRAQPLGNDLPGHLALLVPSRQCLPPVPLSST